MSGPAESPGGAATGLTGAVSAVTAVPAASAADAVAHYARRLAHETDPSDVWAALQAGAADIVVLDVRSPAAYADGHVPGALCLPHPDIGEATLRLLPPGRTAVVYCWGPHCNGAQKGALRLAQLGVPVKEMIGGIDGWVRDGNPVDRG